VKEKKYSKKTVKNNEYRENGAPSVECKKYERGFASVKKYFSLIIDLLQSDVSSLKWLVLFLESENWSFPVIKFILLLRIYINEISYREYLESLLNITKHTVSIFKACISFKGG